MTRTKTNATTTGVPKLQEVAALLGEHARLLPLASTGRLPDPVVTTTGGCACRDARRRLIAGELRPSPAAQARRG